MENQDSKKQGKRIVQVWCFVTAFIFASVGVWLCFLGDFPAIKVGDNNYIMFGGMSINGVDVPGWAFYFIPTGLFGIAIVLVFIGWRKSKVSRHEDA